jgi:hypothetical protein
VLRHQGFASQPMGENSKKPREDLEVVIRKEKEFKGVEFRLVFNEGIDAKVVSSL